uniref:Retrotransposon protein, putative, unclassified n=1 Tax=Oryza sativa subsp. japonica TaxID=39947 RepID=Q338J6_ORYSJ|nr:retrotransposon protein, putative, unclassified [Oryza sativa Japonica Group]
MVKKLFDTVPEKFVSLVAGIEQFYDVDTMPFEEAVGRLKAYEEWMWKKKATAGGVTADGQVLLTQGEWEARFKKGGGETSSPQKNKPSGEGANHGQAERGRGRGRGRGGTQRSGGGSSGGGRDKSHIKCFNCEEFGHYSTQCPHPKKKKAEAHLVQTEDAGPALLLAVTEAVQNAPRQDAHCGLVVHEERVWPRLMLAEKGAAAGDLWYLDNGASNHMSGDRRKFRELDETMTGQVRFGDASSVQIMGMGSILFSCKNGDQWLLDDVYYIPSLCCNMVSLGQLTETGHRVMMDGDDLKVFDKNPWRLVMKVRRTSNRLYRIELQLASQVCLLASLDNPAWLWHARIGHVNFHALKLLVDKEMASGVPTVHHPNQLCQACLVAKQVRQPFPGMANYRAEAPLELLHMDLCGPITPSTFAGNRYFMLIVDDFSNWMWVFVIKLKDQALAVFEKFKPLAKNTVGRTIKTLRTDRGGEFLSGKFARVCDAASIERHLTAPYSPQQNDVVERRNRTVMAMARSLLKGMSVPGRMWGEAVRHAIFLLNWLPTKAMGNRTPFEAWTGKKPHLGHLRVFGCTAHAKVTAPHLKKLDDRSNPFVYLGVEEGSKAHRLFDPRRRQIIVSRDVVFDENTPWQWSAAAGEVTSTEFEVEEPVGAEQPALAEQAGLASPHTAGSDVGPVRYRSLAEIMLEAPRVDLVEDDDDARALLAEMEEPLSYREATGEPAWVNAMNKELEAIEKNKTWSLCMLPAGHKAIGLKWVFKLKKNTAGEVIKHKARLVANGYVQQQGVDFDEVFAPVARLDTVRAILAVAADRRWQVHHLDVKSAFLNGDLEEEVYVSQLEGFVEKGKEHLVYELSKALYGLRQAPRAWNTRLDRSMKELGFSRPSEITAFKQQMMGEFEISDLGLLTYYLGIEVLQGTDGIAIKQAAYARKILTQFGMLDCNSTSIPIEHRSQLHKVAEGSTVDPTEYRRVIGCLRYLLHTQPDLSYAVGVVSKFMEQLTVMHFKAVKQILRYLKGTINCGLMFSGGNDAVEITGFTDSDLAGDSDDRRSTSGMAFYFNSSLVSWSSQKQKTVALSSCEAEFMAATAAACQALWLRGLLIEMIGAEARPVKLYVDNKSAIALMKNPVFHGRSKHIDTRYHFIRECVESGKIQIEFVRTEEQRADALTKGLPAAR